jgi:hypothetical protein
VENEATSHDRQPFTAEQIRPDQPVGDPLLISKPHEWTRIMVQNTNGVSIGKEGNLVVLLDHIKRMEIK